MDALLPDLASNLTTLNPNRESSDAGVQTSRIPTEQVTRRARSSSACPSSPTAPDSVSFCALDIFAPSSGTMVPKSNFTSASNQTAPLVTPVNFEQEMIAAAEKMKEAEEKYERHKSDSENKLSETRMKRDEDRTATELRRVEDRIAIEQKHERYMAESQGKHERYMAESNEKFEQYKTASEQKFLTYKMETDEIIVQHRIRIAVLENDINSKKEEAEQAKIALLLVVQTLGSNGLTATVAMPTSIKATDARSGEQRIGELKEEIGGLRKETRGLRASIRRREWDEPQSRQIQPGVGDSSANKLIEACVKIEDWQTTGVKINDNKKAEIVSGRSKRFATPFGSDPPKYPSGIEILPNGELRSPDESFGSSSATIANIPMLARNHSAGIANVGMILNLEDVLGGELDEVTPARRDTSRIQSLSDGQDIKQGEKTIEEQMLEHDLAMKEFQNAPKPGVLKIGTGIQGGVRGQAYVAKEGGGYNSKEYDYGIPRNYHNVGRYQGHEYHKPLGFMPKGRDFRGFMDKGARVNLSTEHEMLLERGFDPNLWNSIEERNTAVDNWRRSADKKEQHFPEFFKHNVVYVPSEKDNNILRTVHIGNLPTDIALREVLAKVRGGQVIHGVLLNTFKQTGAMSALLTFVKESAADDFVTYTGIYPLTFDDDDEKIDASVTLITTPTYPMSTALINKLNNHGSTRCLQLPNFPTDFSLTRLERNIGGDNKYRTESIVEMYFTTDKTLHLEFASINAAGSAFAILTRWLTYQGLEVHYAPDPCSGPVEELQLETKPRMPLFPKYGFADGSLATRDAYSDKIYDVEVKAIDTIPRKHLAALDNQKVDIPDFSGKNLMATPWADDTGSEDEPLAVKSVSVSSSTGLAHAHGPIIMRDPKEVANALKIHGINSKMGGHDHTWIARNGLLQPPVGLGGSHYAGRESRSTIATGKTDGRLSSTEEQAMPADVIESGGTQNCSEDERCMAEEQLKKTELGLEEQVEDGENAEEKTNPDEINLA